MTRDEIVQIAWDVGLFMRSQQSQDKPTKLERFAERIAAVEKQKVVVYMNSRAFATGHGDTIDDLLKELEWQVAEREREACAKACEHLRDFFSGTSLAVDYENHSPSNSLAYTQCAAAIRARGEV